MNKKGDRLKQGFRFKYQGRNLTVINRQFIHKYSEYVYLCEDDKGVLEYPRESALMEAGILTQEK